MGCIDLDWLNPPGYAVCIALGLMEMPSFIANALVKALDIWTFPIFRFGIRNGRPYAELLLDDAPHEGIDARLEKIEVARKNLADALDAMDELRAAAESNKAELANALQRLSDAKEQRASAERELKEVQSIAQADVEVFRRLAGVPSKLEIAKERFIGFLIGLLASIVASGLWWVFAKLWPVLK